MKILQKQFNGFRYPASVTAGQQEYVFKRPFAIFYFCEYNNTYNTITRTQQHI